MHLAEVLTVAQRLSILEQGSAPETSNQTIDGAAN